MAIFLTQGGMTPNDGLLLLIRIMELLLSTLWNPGMDTGISCCKVWGGGGGGGGGVIMAMAMHFAAEPGYFLSNEYYDDLSNPSLTLWHE